MSPGNKGRGRNILVVVNGRAQGRGVAYSSIQEAVENAEEGYKILVTPGTYEETVEVETDDLSIKGVNKNNMPILTGDLYIFSEDVQVDNLEVKGDIIEAALVNNAEELEAALDNEDVDTIIMADGTIIENNVVIDRAVYLKAESKHGATIDASGVDEVGILVDGENLGEVTIEGFVVKFNDIGGIGQGMGSSEGTSVNIIDNKIIAPDEVVQHGNSIQVTGDGSKILGNTVEVTHQPAEDWGASGILVFGASDVEVRNNAIYEGEQVETEGTDRGIGIGGDEWGMPVAQDNIIEDNEINGLPVGIDVGEGTTGSDINGNNFTENDIHLIDYSEDLDLEAILDANIFPDEKAEVVGNTIQDILENNAYNLDSGFVDESIQAVIEDVDTEAGDTILVAKGTYQEAIEINVEGLTLKSAEEHAALIKNDEIVAGGDVMVNVEAENVTVEGFTVETFPADGQDPGGIGLNGDGSKAINNKVYLEAPGNAGVGGSGDGILAEYNHIIDGSLTYGGDGSATFRNNVVEGEIADGEAFWAGWPDMYDGLVIKGNDFTGVGYDSPVEETLKLTVGTTLEDAGASVNDETADGTDINDLQPVADAVEENNEGIESVLFDAEGVTIDY